MACRVQAGRIWINRVGTYGLGSAAYWWARVASAVFVRLLHYALGTRGLREALLFADDELTAAGDQRGIEALGLGVFLLQALGAPWSWR